MHEYVLPWKNYKYQKLPMGICSLLDIFQHKINRLFVDLDYVRTYICKLLIIISSSTNYYLKKIEAVLAKSYVAGLDINDSRFFFSKEELEYPE